MLVVGLTGGIGSGKSTVASLLAEEGAVVIDADKIVRGLQHPGSPIHTAIVERFGADIVAADGTIDRAALAGIVFSDGEALAELNAIIHPAVGVVIAERLAAEAETDHVVILDIPLLVESGRVNTAGVIVVDCPTDVAVGRAVEQRGMSEPDVRRRMAAQVSREERVAKADFVIDNGGERKALTDQVDRCWAWIESLVVAARETSR